MFLQFGAMFSLCDGWDGSFTNTLVWQNCTIEFTYCFRITEQGFHEIKIAKINVLAPCNGSFFDNNKEAITDEIIKFISLSPLVVVSWDNLVPECPDYTCLIKWNDAICYDGWGYNSEEKKWEMNVCDEVTRSCNETIHICFESEPPPRHLKVERIGFFSGPPCPEFCTSNCE